MQLYEREPYTRDFSAVVLSCEETVTQEGQPLFWVELEDTAFYPEGGGQPWDTGVLGEASVTEVHKKEGKIIHGCSEPLMVGLEVRGQVDWTRRFDLMQQHSGEHIVSGFACSLFQCDNVGFHLGKDVVTIDFNVELSWEQVELLQNKANQYILENHAIDISYPQGEALAQLAYRSKKELTGEVRIVSFPEADTCACCGVHVETSGEVQLVLILSCQKFRQGARMELLCGGRALAFLRNNQQENNKISQMLSAKPLETSVAVEKLLKEKATLEKRLLAMEKERVFSAVKQLGAVEHPVLFLEDYSTEGLRMFTTELLQTATGNVHCFLQEGEMYRYAIATKEGDVRPLVKALNEAFSGRGGGKPGLCQGSLVGKQEEIEEFIKKTVC